MDDTTAKMGIMQLQARYVDAVWRKDHETIGSLFTEDGEWRIAGEVIKGRANLIAFSKRSQATSRALLVTLRTPALDIGKDGTATGRTYFTAQNFLKDGTLYTPIGMYYERFVFLDGAWKFKWRLFQTLYGGAPDGSGQLVDFPDYGPPPAMPPLDAVPSIKGALWENEKK